MDKKLNLLNEKVDKLLHFQEDLTGKLQQLYKGIDDIEKDINKLTLSRAAPDETDAMKNVLKLSDTTHQADIQSICSEVLKLMKAVQLDASKHKERLTKIEKRVDTLDKVITFMGEIFKNSKVVDFILKGIVPWKKGSLLEILVEAKDKPEESGAKPKHVLSNRGTQTESKKPVTSSTATTHKVDPKPQVKERTAQLQGAEGAGKTQGSKICQQPKDSGVKALNQHNGLPSLHQEPVGPQNAPAKAKDVDRAPHLEEHHKQLLHQKVWEKEPKPVRLGTASREAAPSTSRAVPDAGGEVTRTSWKREICRATRAVGYLDTQFVTCEGDHGHSSAQLRGLLLEQLQKAVKGMSFWMVRSMLCSVIVHMTETKEQTEVTKERSLNDQRGKSPKEKPPSSAPAETEAVKQLPDKLKLNQSPRNTSTETNREVKGDNKQSQPLTSSGGSGSDANQCAGTAPEKTKPLEDSKEPPQQDGMIIDDSPSPPAPFEHRTVSVKQTEVTTCYSVCRHEVLGGGRFGQVHKCTEISTGLNLAAKIIKVKGAKEKEEVKNEINIMNQLNHVNLIQLYDAFEGKNNVTLIMEYLDGGELFDRITDENYNLTELDAILFTKQICEGVHYLHQHYILHLDLKPENILCVNHTGNQIKIIDFGLARRYKPREKLKVNFGTPEFLAPEVVNYDFVSFPTDMWSVGVITYMLLSGLSPFLGETDAETMNYVVNCSWDFDAEAFEQLSEEAKDFISRLLVKEKSCRMSATQCLKHEWLNNLPAKAKKSKRCLKSQLLLQSYMAQRKWKKHFYAVAAANRLKRFQSMSVKLA
ncbi:MYLK3 kinase, partial [Nothoprocta ornata]|nr:MYLK3 kinase [Nothoprocta ornata]